jgi:tartronate-semialdehyde synthase
VPERAFDDKDTCFVTTIGLSQIAAAQFLHVYKPRHWINCGQADRSAGRFPPRSACASPTRRGASSRCPATTTSSS